MNPLRVLFFASVATVTAHAGPEEAAILAAMKLADQPNYSWKTTVVDDARTYDIEGKTNAASHVTWVRLPMVKTIADRLGRDAEPDIEAFFAPGVAPVLRTARGWQALTELPKRSPDCIQDDYDPWLPMSSTQMAMMSADPFGNDPFSTPPVPVFRPPPPDPDDDERPYSNAQFAVSHPHDELSVIVGSYTALKVDGNIATGILNDTGAQLLLVHEGQSIKPLAAAGMFKLLVQNGRVAKYMLQLEGVLQVGRKKKVYVHELATTVITNVGSTHFAVPDAARLKLAR